MTAIIIFIKEILYAFPKAAPSRVKTLAFRPGHTRTKILNLSPERDEEHPRNFHVGFPFPPSYRRVGDVDLHRVAVQ